MLRGSCHPGGRNEPAVGKRYRCPCGVEMNVYQAPQHYRSKRHKKWGAVHPDIDPALEQAIPVFERSDISSNPPRVAPQDPPT
jgi:hypothetical protein